MRSVVCIWPTCSLLMAPELNLWNVAVLFFLTFRFKKNLKSSLNKIDLQNVFVKFMDVFPLFCRAVFLSSFRMFLTWTLIILCSCFSLSACWETAVFFSLFFVFVFNQTLFLDNSSPSCESGLWCMFSWVLSSPLSGQGLWLRPEDHQRVAKPRSRRRHGKVCIQGAGLPVERLQADGPSHVTLNGTGAGPSLRHHWAGTRAGVVVVRMVSCIWGHGALTRQRGIVGRRGGRRGAWFLFGRSSW